jgi:hypothetical protein
MTNYLKGALEHFSPSKQILFLFFQIAHQVAVNPTPKNFLPFGIHFLHQLQHCSGEAGIPLSPKQIAKVAQITLALAQQNNR